MVRNGELLTRKVIVLRLIYFSDLMHAYSLTIFNGSDFQLPSGNLSFIIARVLGLIKYY
jgi:hypothetical protein